MLCDNLDGWDGVRGREAQKGGDARMHIADPRRCMAETKAAL